MDQHFVFNLGALVRVVLIFVLWRILTQPVMTEVVVDPPTPGPVDRSPSERERADAGEDSRSQRVQLRGIDDRLLSTK